jgi:hypothetical protein
METRPDLEFDYYLAERLGRSVAEMRRSVSAAEWRGWSVFYARKAQRRELELAKVRG